MKNGTPISKQVVCLEPFLQTDWDMMWVTKLVSQKMSQMISECANQFVKKNVFEPAESKIILVLTWKILAKIINSLNFIKVRNLPLKNDNFAKKDL